jgi:hypothetical protein
MNNDISDLVDAIREEQDRLEKSLEHCQGEGRGLRHTISLLQDENVRLSTRNDELHQQMVAVNALICNSDAPAIGRKAIIIGRAIALLQRAMVELEHHRFNAYCELDIIDDTLMDDIKVCKEALVAAGLIKEAE